MYESQTYEVILTRALARVSPDIDTRPGSIIYDAIAPACVELAQMYTELDNVLKQIFANTASGDYLTNRCSEFGVNRMPATYAIRKGVFTGALPPEGTRFGLGELTYAVTDNIGGLSDCELTCEQSGVQGNADFGSIIPIDNIAGLTAATLSDVLIPGEDEETDEDLYERFNEIVNNPIYAGNANQYKVWALEVAGVGDAKIIPTWNGANTVKVVIIDADKTAATPELVADVQDYIDPDQDGSGSGLAPIGAVVTVISASELAIDVSATLTIEVGADLPTITGLFETALTTYLAGIAFEQTLVRYSQIANLLLDIPGVIDYTDLTVNAGTGNVVIADDEVPVLGTTIFN